MGLDIQTFEAIQDQAEKEYPYVVQLENDWDCEHDYPCTCSMAKSFRTWSEALAKQVEWNKSFKGHRARRRRKGERAMPYHYGSQYS